MQIAQIAHLAHKRGRLKLGRLGCGTTNRLPREPQPREKDSLIIKSINSALKHGVNFAVALSLLIAVAVGPNVAAAANGTAIKKSDKALSADIVDTAVAAGNFTTLAKALEAAGLIDALKGEGPFTVFAPTDAAFAQTSSRHGCFSAQG